MYDALAVLVFVVAFLLVYCDSVPTGILGSVGLAMIGGGALLSVDDGASHDARRMSMIMVIVLTGFLLLVLHAAAQTWRRSRPGHTMRRRSTDQESYGGTDA